jgi:hypothetical protein
MKSCKLSKLIGVLLLSLLITYLPAQVKVGDNPSVQEASAILELEKENMGLLITRVSLSDAVDNATIPSPANSLLVFNTNTSSTEDNNAVSPGFYYWDDNQGRWVRLNTGSAYAYNVTLGWNAGEFNSSINVNALGWQAAQHNFGSSVNTMGENAGLNNLGDDLNAFGFMAAQNNLVGVPDTARLGAVNALGSYSAQGNKGSIVNALGPASGEQNSGWSVNFLGSQSGQFNSGSEVNAMGAMAAQHNTTSAVNAFGRLAAQWNTGYGTNALGDQAAQFNNGAHAVAIGNDALIGIETGDPEGEGNIGIGFSAGSNVGTGKFNICIGYDTDIPFPADTNQINIGNSIIRTEDGVIQLKDLIRLTPLATAPASPSAGMIYFSSSDNKLKVYDGSTWQNCW